MTTRAPTDVELEPWVRFLRAHAAVTRDLSTELVTEHGLTINDYEVLLWLSRASERRLRRVDLAEQVVLTPSGITRLLERLERAGWVARESCPTDARVVYAKLTDDGYEQLRAAARTHVAGIRRRFLEPFDEGERAVLAELLRRLENGD